MARDYGSDFGTPPVAAACLRLGVWAPPVQSVACGGDFQPAHKPAARCSQPFSEIPGLFLGRLTRTLVPLLTPPSANPLQFGLWYPLIRAVRSVRPCGTPSISPIMCDGSDLATAATPKSSAFIGFATRKRCDRPIVRSRRGDRLDHQATRTLVPPRFGLPVNPFTRPTTRSLEPTTTRTLVPHATSGSSSCPSRSDPSHHHDSADFRCSLPALNDQQ